ncbi:dehydrogenase/reductase SDR family member 7 [Schistocerca serialis cubense]|uniref:dehydrogenase/reductase SDR family member 7 n=1 Tax=Schistocerca serialis cubense TaxID=2023355 RepID=UPI00214DFB37|nr:dehydrogenase/reductase SDR family member 7 [Schistocerca serialis cubense]XP_049954269.1 dehydrogenase/reductase SDR family member 7 [Schistocerca serialis cubense]
MDFLMFVGLVTVVYFIVYVAAICLSDCDLEMKWNEIFGKPVGSLVGKVIWITGASSGIGESLAVILAKHNVKLILSARREKELERVKQKCLEWGNLNPHDVLVLPFDVTAVNTHDDTFSKVIHHFGKLDILVNNAGRSQRAIWEDIDLEVDKAVFDINVFSIISLSRIAVKYFLKRGEGHIAVTSSSAGVFGVPFSGSYTASKHALHGYFNSLLSEKMGMNLHVSLLCPGPTFSNFLSECFTGRPGEKFNKTVSKDDKRMTTERCAHLCAVALANKQREAWMGIFPIIPLLYLLYFPNVGKFVWRRLGPKWLLKLRDSKESIKTE